MNRTKSLALGLFVTLTGALSMSAQADGPPPLPEEAFAACQGKSAGDACTTKMRDHTEDGTCVTERSGTRVFCMPKRPPGPPPEAVAACEGKHADDACSVTFGDHTMNGACAAGPDGRLACAPAKG